MARDEIYVDGCLEFRLEDIALWRLLRWSMLLLLSGWTRDDLRRPLVGEVCVDGRRSLSWDGVVVG